MRRVSSIVLLIPLILSCSGSETVEPVNQPPSISFDFDKIAVRKGWAVNMSVTVGDPDGDPLSVNWDISSGAWSYQDPEKTTVRWTPLDTLGVDTVVVTVSDGEATATTGIQEIKRGTWRSFPSDLTNFQFTKEYSPWIISTTEDAVRIDAGWTVPIDSGVEIYVDTPGFVFEVVGTFKSNGTEAEPVVIKPNNRNLTCGSGGGWWGGIRAITDQAKSGLVDFEHTEIWHAEYNVRTFEYQDLGGASIKLRHCLVVCSSLAGVLMGSNGFLELDHCRITNNQSHGVWINSGVAIPSRVEITNNDISENGNTGIYMELSDVDQTSQINITGNRFQLNSIDGIALSRAAWATAIQYNDFFFNNRSHIRLIAPYPSQVSAPAAWDSLVATHNFWGTQYDPGNDTLIHLKIWDRRDDRDIITRVDVDPWENEPQYHP